ncbi:MAG: MCE family protein [Hyphomicrobiales bacterium]|nr:MCE family protein [Hyphomicrobiales bacterium]
MEFNARYTLIAMFTLTAVGAIFMFIFWLNNSGGFGARAQFQVRFLHPVSGLSRGSDVLFNGLKVGEITKLFLDKEKPGQLSAIIAVSLDTPIRADTTAGIDFQGLTGTANILLTGGVKDAAKLQSDANGLPVLIANPALSRSWTQNAGRVLGRIDDLIGRNTDRFDSILSGLEKMAGGGDKKNQNRVYDLKIPDDFQPILSKPSWQLVIGEPTIVLSLNSDKVLQQVDDGSWVPFADARWSDNLPNLIQTKIMQSFENAGLIGAIIRPADALDPQFRLISDIRTFHFQKTGSPLVVFDLVAKIVDRDGVIVSSRRFRLESPVATSNQQEVIRAFGSVFSSVVKELVNWSVNSLRK